MLGYDPSRMKGGIAQWAGLIHPEDRWALIGELDLAEEKCAPYEVEYRFRRKNGDYVWMRDRGVFVPDAVGKAARRIGTLEGITARRQSEESGHWMRLVFNSRREAVMVTTLEGVLVSVNSAAERMFGYTQEEFEHLSPEALYVDQEHYTEMNRLVNEYFGQNQEAHLRLEARRKNGGAFPTAHTISLIKNDEGQPIAILTVIRDITAERACSEEHARRVSQAHVTAQPARASAAAPALEELYHFNRFCETNFYARGAVASALNQLYRRLVLLIKDRFGYYYVQLFRYGPVQDALLLVEGYGEVGALTQEDQMVLTDLAGQIAIAIENARRLEKA